MSEITVTTETVTAPSEPLEGSVEHEAVEGEAPKPQTGKHKVKRGGKEVELALEELLSAASDDYEHDVPVNGSTKKAKLQDLIRGYQQSEGSFDRLREAAGQRKQLAEMLDYARKDPEWFVENQLGKNPTEWAAEIIRRQIQEEAELSELAVQDPGRYHAILQDRARKDLERKSAFERHKSERQTQAQKEAEQRAKMTAEVDQALKAAGLPTSDLSRTVIDRVMRKYRDVGERPELGQAAQEAKSEFLNEVFGWLDQHDDQGLLGLLGDGRRKRLRDAELKALQGALQKVQEAPQEAQEPKVKAAPKASAKSLSPSDFLKKYT